MTYTEQEPPTRISVERDRVDLGDDVTVLLVKAVWTDGPHVLEGYGMNEADAVWALADRIGDVLHALTEHPAST